MSGTFSSDVQAAGMGDGVGSVLPVGGEAGMRVEELARPMPKTRRHRSIMHAGIENRLGIQT